MFDRKVVLLATTAALALTVTSAASAQATAAPGAAATPDSPASLPAAAASAAGEPDVTGSEVVVTGSRIARSELTSSTPVSVVSAQNIQSTGFSNVQDVLNEVPSFGTPNLSRSNSNFLTSGNGTATLNLRNLGQARTLTLIDGRRSVGVPGQSALDVNNIPTDLIDRIEVVTGGASAVYGSDAVAGVVNFVLKDHFDGLRVRSQNTISPQGDAARQLVSVTGGKDFADNRGHFIANFEFDDDHGLRSADRAFSAHDATKSSYPAQGLFSLNTQFKPNNGTTFTFNDLNQLKPYQSTAIDGYDRNQDRYLSVPVRRMQGAALGNFELTPGIKLYGEGEYSHVFSSSSLEPAPVGSSGTGVVTNFDGSPYAGIPITNPYIPAAIRSAMQAAGVTTLQFRRRSNDIYTRSNRDVRDYWRGVGGVKGDVLGWHFDLSYEHSENRERTTTENISASAYGAALDATRDSSGNIVCADPVARAAGCVPINIFGFNTVTPAAANFLKSYPGTTDAARGLVHGGYLGFLEDVHVRQDDVVANVNGTLFNLPGGPLTLALGAEYRREYSADVPDPYTQAGVTTGNQLGAIKGSFNVKEVYAEAVAPILSERRLVNYLGLEGAFRHADYSSTGGVNSYKIGGEYAPVRGLRARVMYAQATRAPDIFELFQNASQTYYGSISDPCDQGAALGDLAKTLQPLPAACTKIPGVAQTIARDGSFAYSTAQLQSVQGLTGGNRNLKPETAHTLTAGLVFAPPVVPGFSLTADYYDIRVKNAIGSVDQNLSVQQCFANGNPFFCNAVTRDSGGFVTGVNTFLLNTGTARVSGIDVQAAYTRHFGSDDTLSVNVYWNHLLKQQSVPYPGGAVQKEVGQSDTYPAGTRLGSGFHNRVNANATLQHGPVSFVYRLEYKSPVVTDLSDPTERLPAVFYHDIQLRVAFGEQHRFELFGGVNNLLNRKPPLVSDAYNFPGTETLPSSYDVYGRMLYAGVDVKF